ncbi:dephospho-CoA kinase [Laceyella sacchari]|uniref:Dephospho-CoA kinase n=1 Tax=Laceyella sacchari TaxID=37482 RepID=A0ABY5U4C5_LACSH|nr:dephospho-CoA kinase [Laceyella sacchari]UWE04492.1 dephospho-CoA kinase [Laceyella sacchari]
MIFGLTGGIATGKSTVAEMLQRHGAVIVDADKVARQVVEPGEEGLSRIASVFGDEVISREGTLDRPALGRIIFHDEKARRKLNELLHPLIMDKMRRDTEKVRQTEPHAVIIWDVPLLIEEKMTDLVDEVILVYVPQQVQLARLQARDHLDSDEAAARLAAQLPIDEKKRWADYVIDNSGTREETAMQVARLWSELCAKVG